MGNYLEKCCNFSQEKTKDAEKENPELTQHVEDTNRSRSESKISKKAEIKNKDYNFSTLSVDDFEFKLWLKGIYQNKLALVSLINSNQKRKGSSNSTQRKNLFVMKIVSMEEINLQKIDLNFKEQVEKLIEYKHPFIIDIKFFFYDKINLYFVTEYVPGSDLQSYLRLFGSFSEKTTKFFIAEILTALDFIHNQLDCSLDKLDLTGVQLDQQGHIKLTNFGMKTLGVVQVKKGTVTELLQSNSAYFAPEVIEKQELNNKVSDFWSIGCLVFEMLNGKPAFSSNVPKDLFLQIIDGRASISEKKISTNARNFISEQLKVDYNERLGAKNGIEEIKAHPFFEDINWEQIYKKEVLPPFVPLLKVTKDDEGNLELN